MLVTEIMTSPPFYVNTSRCLVSTVFGFPVNIIVGSPIVIVGRVTPLVGTDLLSGSIFVGKGNNAGHLFVTESVWIITVKG